MLAQDISASVRQIFPLRMKSLAICCSAMALSLLSLPARAMSLDDACARFSSKLNAAVQAGNTAQAQQIYQQGSQRIASNFNGATCPNVQPPAGSN